MRLKSLDQKSFLFTAWILWSVLFCFPFQSFGGEGAKNRRVEKPAIIPLPTRMKVSEGVFVLTPKTRIIFREADCKATAQYLAGVLAPATGFKLDVAQAKPSDNGDIFLTMQGADPTLGEEGYELTVVETGVVIKASKPAGLFYGCQTLRQLFPPTIMGTEQVAGTKWTASAIHVWDKPRFAWRGLMLDTGHDFQELPFILRFLDWMAVHKLNTFHWHITDLGTWPLEIKGYSRLLDSTTRRKGVKPGHYTQDDVRKVVQYAAALHITVVPEIDMPGHSIPALLAYPELDCPVPAPAAFGRFKPWEYCVGNEKTYEFLQEVLTQVMELFPSKFIHIGGDECPKDHWKKCPVCQAKMKAEGLKNESELQSYFVKRIEKFLNSKGRRLIGWNEILEGGLAPNATVMSWQNVNGGIVAAKAGHDVVMAPESHLYFDRPESANFKAEPGSLRANPVTIEKVYSFEPIPKILTSEQAKHVLGAQAQMWSDTHPTEKNIERLVYPRACALAEVVWTDPKQKDWGDFTQRLTFHVQRLKMLNINYRPLTPGQK